MGHPDFFSWVSVLCESFSVSVWRCHVAGYFGVGDGFGGEGEGSFFFYFARGSHESSEGGAGEGASYADSFDAGGCEFFDGKGCVLETHEDVDGFRDGGADLADGFE